MQQTCPIYNLNARWGVNVNVQRMLRKNSNVKHNILNSYYRPYLQSYSKKGTRFD